MNGLIALNKVFKKYRIWENPITREVYSRLYFLYKRHFEDVNELILKSYPNFLKKGNVLDIGANIGYTAITFGNRLRESPYKVYAFEPEPGNFRELQRNIGKFSLEGFVETFLMAVSDTEEEKVLFLSNESDADHRIFNQKTVPAVFEKKILVQSIRVDDFVLKKSKSSHFPISLMKIDVQGHELQVLRGAEQTLRDNPDVVVIAEYSPSMMTEMGMSIKSFFDFFKENNFLVYKFEKKIGIRQVEYAKILNWVPKRSYEDLIFSRREENIKCG